MEENVNIWANKYPTVRSNFGVVLNDKLIVHGDNPTTIRIHERANTGSYVVNLRSGNSMSYDEILKAYANGEHEKEVVGGFDNIPDLPTVPNGQPLNFKASQPTKAELEAIQAHLYPVKSAPPVNIEEDIEESVKDGEVEAPAVVKPVPVQVNGKRKGRPVLYDFAGLKVGGSMIYVGKLATARVLASLAKGRGEGKFKCVETGNNKVTITKVT